MPIEGPIQDLALSDLLQLLFLSRRTGCLVVRASGREAELRLREGALVGATSGGPELRLGRLFVQSGRATDAQVRDGLELQRKAPARLLGQIMVDAGFVRPAEVERQLRFQIEETVFDLLRVEEGHLHFEEVGSQPRHGIEVELGTDSVLMDATRRLDEFAEVLQESAHGDPLPRLAFPDGSLPPTPLHLGALEWEVLGMVDGERSLRQIARALGQGELQVARALYALAEAGVVEVGARAVEGREGGDDAASLYREIDRAIREGRSEQAGTLLQSVRSLSPARGIAAEQRLMEGRVLALAEDWGAAASALEDAVRIDPLLAEAYFHLARVAVRCGELARAESALRVYQRLNDPSEPRRESAERMVRSLEELRKSMSDAEP
ncbi:MAG: DUF4388 domain-containing protein [Gemmatimonas sp.]|nr:DUF4388 domain-containing protein [Gemmatimonas sp.]